MRWSNSMLSVAQSCGEKFRRMYVERDFRPSGPGAKRGTAVHKVAATSHLRQFLSRESGQPREIYLASVLPTDEEAKDLAATAFDAAVERDGVVYSEDERAIGEEKVLGEQKDAAVAMASHYVATVAPRVDPVGVERKVVIRPKGTDVEIVGIVDLVSEEVPSTPDGSLEEALTTERKLRLEGQTKRIEIVNDLKTANRSPQEDAVERSQQLALYALIRAAETGKPPDRVRLRTLLRTRTGKVSHVEQTGVKTTEDLDAVAQRLDAAIRMVESGVFLPANPDSWWCGEKWCAYWKDCRFALGRGR